MRRRALRRAGARPRGRRPLHRRADRRAAAAAENEPHGRPPGAGPPRAPAPPRRPAPSPSECLICPHWRGSLRCRYVTVGDASADHGHRGARAPCWPVRRTGGSRSPWSSSRSCSVSSSGPTSSAGRPRTAEAIDVLSDLGLAMLIFLAGYEIDFARRARRHPAPLARRLGGLARGRARHRVRPGGRPGDGVLRDRNGAHQHRPGHGPAHPARLRGPARPVRHGGAGLRRGGRVRAGDRHGGAAQRTPPGAGAALLLLAFAAVTAAAVWWAARPRRPWFPRWSSGPCTPAGSSPSGS